MNAGQTLSAIHGPQNVPTWVPARFGVSASTLTRWHLAGWLGMTRVGTGGLLAWDRPDVLAQLGWLSRLRRSGRLLDSEDAVGGFRLRSRRDAVEYGLRDARGRWEPARPPVVSVDGAYTLARVNGAA